MESKVKIIVLFCLRVAVGNLICNGDFQKPVLTSANSGLYTFILDNTKIRAGELVSDANCWYRYPDGKI